MTILLTGATGFLGREVLARLARRDRPLIVTGRVPPGGDLEATRVRVLAALREADPDAPTRSIEVVAGDVTRPELGLAAPVLARLRSRDEGPIHVLHGAAEVRFDLPREIMERQNVEGTRHVVALARELADAGRLSRLDYVSTAYVAGARTDEAPEDAPSPAFEPRNEYERSKRLAEAVVRDSGLAACIHRPSIIVGDSRTGRAGSFKVLYWPLKLYARGQWRWVFGRPACSIDVVPVDFVADAMLALMDAPETLGQTFHLAAGPERASTIGALASLAERFFARGRVRYVDPDIYFRYLRPVVLPLMRLLRPGLAERGRVFLPYLTANPQFSTARAQAVLAPRALGPPRVEDYFGAIMRYARDTDFGRRLELTG